MPQYSLTPKIGFSLFGNTVFATNNQRETLPFAAENHNLPHTYGQSCAQSPKNGVKNCDMKLFNKPSTQVENANKTNIRYVKKGDKQFWFSLDNHLSAEEFEKKVRDKQGYVILENNRPIGILRYNLFWDNTPFCTLICIENAFRQKGYGKALMNFWEGEMHALGYDWLLVSTQSDENAQHFYRALGYQDCGCLIAPNQPMELFLSKRMDI